MSIFDILPTDKAFAESPREGDPTCHCSRCGELIGAYDFAIRAMAADGRFELRYHAACVGLDGETGQDRDEPI